MPLLTLQMASPSVAFSAAPQSYGRADPSEVDGGWRFQPRFFLWPVNLVRTPLGLAGCAFSGVDKGAHWGASRVSLPVGIGIAMCSWLVRCTFVHWAVELSGGDDELTAEDGMTYVMPCMGISSAVLETFILPLDAVHTLLHGEPTWYFFARHRESRPDAEAPKGPWSDAIKRQWHFAWDYKLYPPLPYWPGRM